MTDRLAELEVKAAALNAEIAKLKAERPAPPPQPPRDEVRIVPLLAERTNLPSLKELQRLYAAVKDRAPWPLDTRYDEDKPFRGFVSCFRWLSNKPRTDMPNSKFALGFWLDACRIWLHDRNSMTRDIDASTLILAVYAQGDICFTPADSTRGWVWELGLAEHVGRKAVPDAWKRVLEGSVMAPSAPPRRMAQPSNVRIVVG